ncbi:MAG TPA: hypothetical protein VI612_04780 [Candidatus Nanoarchaeia archaeon]|nr:hypothetical protein [Candidatus Nanoarchaeia archaeon]
MLNPKYDVTVLSEARKYLMKNGNVQLLDILSSKGLKKLSNAKWSHKYEPLKFSVHVANPPIIERLPALLQFLTGLKQWKYSFLSLKQGDYSVLYDKLKPSKGFAFFLDINSLDESWGGYTSFMKKEEVFRVVPKKNSLTLINQSGLRHFHKYVDHKARNPRIFLYGVLQ